MHEDRPLCIDDETRKVGRTSHGAWRLYLWGLQSIDPARHSGVVRPAGNFVVGNWKFLSGENSSTNRWNGRWRPSGASQCYLRTCLCMSARYPHNQPRLLYEAHRCGTCTCDWTLCALTILRESARGRGHKQPSATRDSRRNCQGQPHLSRDAAE